MNTSLKKITAKIHGMHCASCEVTVERCLKAVPGVEQAHVRHSNGKAVIYASANPRLEDLQRALAGEEYKITWWHDRGHEEATVSSANTRRDYLEMGAMFLFIVGLYLLLNQFDLIPKRFVVSEQMSYGVVFGIGLVAALSTCLAVTGGLLVAVSAKYHAAHPGLTPAQKFKPHLLFNIGRVLSYTVLGGLVGKLGSAITLSPSASGWLTIIVSVVMLLLGFQLLNLFPSLRRFQPRMPKWLAHRIHDLSGKQQAAPFFLGASTFFLPCGFTQALQLYVLSKGSFTVGALTMLAFSLGTLPALLSLGAVSSFMKGAWRRYLMKFSGVLVVAIGIFSINNGLALGSGALRIDASKIPAVDPNVQMIGGKQVVRMKVRGLSYEPSQFRVRAGIPVEWQIDGAETRGCAGVIVVPSLGITGYLPRTGVKTIRFTPERPGKIAFSCPMGMTTRGAAFIVVADDARPATDTTRPEGSVPSCDPRFANCL